MQSREFGRTGRKVSEIGFGAWAIGAAWGEVNDDDALAALHAALDAGVTFLDTADVYGDGRSEKLIARVMKERGGERPFIATKAGRRLPKQTVEGYSLENLTGWIDRSLKTCEADTLDLVQLHCPPTDLYYHPRGVRAARPAGRAGQDPQLRRQRRAGRGGAEGDANIPASSACRSSSTSSASARRSCSSTWRRRSEVAIIARVPLASGLLSGKFSADTKFEATDHRQFNRNGEAFDVGETFSGVPYEVGLAAVEKVRPLVGGRHHHGEVRAALDPDVRRGHRRHPRRPQPGAGGSQCRGRGLAAAAGCD